MQLGATSRPLAFAATSNRSSLLRLGPWVALALAVGWATWARLALRASGPELDTDAFAHMLIGRRMLEDWRDLRVHWVWLPLWHVVDALVTLAGGTLEQVRVGNTLLAMLPPFLLAATLRGHLRARPALAPWLTSAECAIPFVAGALLALWPLCIALGQSGQPEVLFQTLVLGACLAWQREHAFLAGVLLALAALLRYEAWLLPPVFLALWAARRPRAWRGMAAWILPGMAIVAWCWVHYCFSHEPLQFLRLNREYLRQAFIDLRLPWADDPSLLHSLLWYPVTIPARDVGGLLWFAALGAPWFALRAPPVHRSVALVLLTFLVYAWVRRINLGLARHFAIVAPFYATSMAAAACCAFAWAAARLQRLVHAPLAATLAGATLALLVLWNHAIPSVHVLRRRQALAFLADRRAADALRANVGATGRVYCDQPRIEVFSRLPPWRFIRWTVSDVRPYNMWALANARGTALAVSIPAHVVQLRGHSRVVHDDGSFVVMRYDRQIPALPPSTR